MRAIIDTAGDILYKSFYILGLTELLGSENVQFSSSPFTETPYTLRNDKVMNFGVQEGVSEKRYIIACNDHHAVILNSTNGAMCMAA